MMMSSQEMTPALDSDQRSRLIKSSRKMGRVLGTTPRVHHEPALRTFATAPFDVTYAPSRPSTGSSTAHTLPSRLPVLSRPHTSSGIPSRSSLDSNNANDASVLRKERRPAALILGPPVLRFKTSSASLRPRAPSPTPSLSSLPMGRPNTPPPDPAELRRKKMDKLMRTLGEHIPAELVFPGLPASPRSTKAQRRGSIISVLTTLTNTPRSPTFPPVAVSPPLREFQVTPAPKRRGNLAASLFRKPSTTLRAVISASKPWPNLTGYEEPASKNDWETTPLSRPETPWESVEGPRNVIHWGEIAPRPSTPLDTPALTPADTPLSSPTPSPPPSAPPTPPRESLDSEEMHIVPLSPRPKKQVIRRSHSAREATRMVSNHSHTRSQVMPPVSPPAPSRPESPFVGSFVPIVDGAPPVPKVPWFIEGDEAIIRRERKEGWSGEWNQGNMQDVIQKLRALR